MGNRLIVLALFPRDPPLSLGAVLVLVAMARAAKDSDPEPTYYGGWPVLAMALQRTTYDGAAERAVARYVAELIEAKLVSVEARGVHGRNARYRLHLEPWH